MKKTVVLIDDDLVIESTLTKLLVENGWQLWSARDGEEGYRLVQQHKPLVALVDLHVPKLNGFKICQQIRANPALAAMQIIIITASQFDSDRRAGLQWGADDLLTKPLDEVALLGTLEELLLKVTDLSAPRNDASERTVVRFWGVRGSIPSPGPQTMRIGGNTSCVEVRVGRQLIILDAGSGIRGLGHALLREFKGQSCEATILISHTHWDHIQGFPFFTPAYLPQNTVRIVGCGGEVKGLKVALSEQMQSAFFPINLSQMAGNLTFMELDDLQFNLGAVRVQALFANHPGICLGYRLTTPQGIVVYLCDHECYERAEALSQKISSKASPSALEFAHQQDERVREFMADADVLIADCQYDDEEYPSRRGWGHSCLFDIVQLALRARVKRLYTFHHDPDHTDEQIEWMVARAQEIALTSDQPLEVFAAREKDEIILPL